MQGESLATELANQECTDNREESEQQDNLCVHGGPFHVGPTAGRDGITTK